MTQMVPPHPTTSFSTVSLIVTDWGGIGVPDCDVLLWGFASSSVSKMLSSIHSALAFQTLAMSSHPGRFGRSMWLIRFQASSESDESRCRFDRMILIPSSLIQVTYLPDNDHFMVLIEPSPLCKTVSFPVFAPRPIDPSQLEAVAAAPPMVVELVLVPTRPPVVRTKSPARPPDKKVLSLLYSGDNAIAWTGRPKLRSKTSLGSTNDAMHTFPSIDDVAI